MTLCDVPSATYRPRPFAETRSASAVIDDLITYLRLLRLGVLPLPETPSQAQPQPAVA